MYTGAENVTMKCIRTQAVVTLSHMGPTLRNKYILKVVLVLESIYNSTSYPSHMKSICHSKNTLGRSSIGYLFHTVLLQEHCKASSLFKVEKIHGYTHGRPRAHTHVLCSGLMTFREQPTILFVPLECRYVTAASATAARR